MNRIELDGRTAIVTGAARGIGRAIAERLLASGAAVELWDVNGERMAATASELGAHGPVHHAVVDVARAGEVADAVAEAEARRGAVDILVANAGIMGPVKDSWTYTDHEWQVVQDVVLTGTFNCMRAVLPAMLGRGYGRIVSTASISGKEGSPGIACYSAAKAGVIGLTKAVAREVATKGVLVNCITPGTFDTEMVREASTPELREYGRQRLPMGRFGRVEEIGALVAWLCSEDCSFSTAGVFDISGGRSSH